MSGVVAWICVVEVVVMAESGAGRGGVLLLSGGVQRGVFVNDKNVLGRA